MKRSPYIFDPLLRGADGHLRPSVMRALDRRAEALEQAANEPVSVEAQVEGESDQVYATRIDRANEELDAEWWGIIAKHRPPFSEFLRSKGYQS